MKIAGMNLCFCTDSDSIEERLDEIQVRLTKLEIFVEQQISASNVEGTTECDTFSTLYSAASHL